MSNETVEGLMAQGLEQHEQGNLRAAEQCFAKIVAMDPQNADALHYMGRIAYQSGDGDNAVMYLQKAIAARPNFGEAYNSLGDLLRDVKQHDQALQAYRKARDMNPDIADAHLNEGLILQQQSKTEEAVVCYRKVAELVPDNPQLHHLIGLACHEINELQAALNAYEIALALDPAFTAARFNAGVACQGLGLWEQADGYYRQAATADPTNVGAHANLGIVLREMGRFAEAVEAFREAENLMPENPEVLMHLGMGLMDCGQIGAAEEKLQHALRLSGKDGGAEAHYSMGVIRQQAGLLEEAANCYRKAVAANPQLAEAHLQLGTVLRDLGHFAEAISSMKQAVQLSGNPAHRLKLVLAVPTIAESVEETTALRDGLATALGAMQRSDISIPDPLRGVGWTNFYLAYHGENDRPLQEAIAATYLKACPDLAWEAPHVAAAAAKPKLKIGIISAFFQNHTMGRLNRGLVAQLDRDRFEVVLLRLDGSGGDEIGNEMDAAADRVVTFPQDIAAARQVIAGEELDILFYTDIGMDPLTYYLSFARLAPVQFTTWGHPDTTGVPNMDHFLSCELIEPEGAEAHYSENLVQLKSPPVYMLEPEMPEEAPFDRLRYGVPESGNLYVCPQTLFKLHPDFDATLMKILERDPDGHLLLVTGNSRYWNELILKRFRKSSALASRVSFVKTMPQKDFIGLLRLADVLLDPPSFSGGNTSFEALLAGTPIVTWPGDFMRGRVTLGFFKMMEMPELVADSEDAYVDLACRLATDKAYRTEISQRIRERAPKLFRNQAFVDEFADVVEGLYNQAVGS